MVSRSPSPVLNLRPVQNFNYANQNSNSFGDEYNQFNQQPQSRYSTMASMNSSNSLMRHMNNRVLPYNQESYNVIRGNNNQGFNYNNNNNNENWL